MEENRKETGDPGLLVLFREELEKQLQILEPGLAEIEQALPNKRIDGLLLAVHAIKGAFRVVGFPDAVSLASAMEEILSAFEQSKRCFLPTHIGSLRQAVEIFRAIREQEETDISTWVSGQEASLRQVTQDLWKLLAETENVPFAGSFRAVIPKDGTPEEIKRSIAEANKGKAASMRQGIANLYHPTGEWDGQSPRQILSNQDHLLALAGECLLQARKIRGLHPLLRSLEHGAPVAGTPVVVSDRSKKKGSADKAEKTLATDVLQLFDRSSQQLECLAGQLFDDILESRAVPFTSLIGDYGQRISVLAKELGKVVIFNTEGDRTTMDRDVLGKLEAPLWQLIRHVLVYSLETSADRESAGKFPAGFLSLTINNQAGVLDLILTDDGRGINPEGPREAAEDRDRSEGTQKTSEFDALNAILASLDGSVDWEFSPGEGDKVHLVLPAVAGILNCLLVRIGRENYALPMTGIDRVAGISPEILQLIDGRPWAAIDGENMALIDMGQIFNLPASSFSVGSLPVIVIKRGQDRCGVVVEALLGEENLVLRPLDERLGKVAYIRAAAILGDGSPVLVLDRDDLMETVTLYAAGND